MRNHFYAVWVNYTPNSAPSNRMLAYIGAWAKMDIDVTVVFLLPDRNFSMVSNTYSNINFVYIWKWLPLRVRVIHYLLYDLYVFRLIKMLHSSDKVYVYSQANLLARLLAVEGVSVYHETTEHPAVITLGVRFHTTTINAYFDSCRKLSGLFVISNQLKDLFVEKGVDANKIVIINMVVDPGRFENIKHNSDIDYIAYCGNASNNKDGVDQLIRAFSIVHLSHPELFLYIIGKAPDQKEEDNNMLLAEKLGVGEKVVFTGAVSSDEMPRILSRARILALARPDSLQARYGFPTKLGEYLLTGNPVVLTDVGDISHFLKDEESAMICEPSNEEQFAKKIDWLLCHPCEAAKIGMNGKQIAINRFNNYHEASKIVSFLF